MNNPQFPQHILDAFISRSRNVVIERYVGDRYRINQLWDDAWAARRVYILSTCADRHNSQKGLRELRKLTKAGLLIERKKSYPSEMCQFEFADKEFEQELIQGAYNYWVSYGYNTTEIIERKH